MMKKLLVTLIVVFWPVTAGAWSGKVVGVIDGDSIRLLRPGHGEIEARLYGIDAPEFKQAFGRAAKRNLLSLLAGQEVEVKTMDLDGYGRPVVIVLRDGLNVNEKVVRDGYAWVYRKYCRQPFCDAWIGVENRARLGKLGLWQQKDPQQPWEFRHNQD